MIALWMLYATIIGGLLAAAAHTLEHIVGEHGWPRRWVWLVAIAALPLVPLLTSELPRGEQTSAASYQSAATPPASASVSTRPTMSRAPAKATLSAPARALAAGTAWFGRALISIAALPAVAVRQAQAHLTYLARFDNWLARGWAAITAILLGMYVTAAIGLARRRRRWPSARVDGEAVLVAPDAGPAVVGIIRPAIVLPAWTLGIDARLRALILRHEREHMRAHDPLVLHLTTVASYLLPWNIAVWWMLRRLRIAVELDCDRRVLRAGGDVHRYADLLLAVGGRRSTRNRVLVPALVERQSLLARRILAMCPRRAKFQPLRSTCAAGTAYMLLAAAYAIPMPALTKKMNFTSYSTVQAGTWHFTIASSETDSGKVVALDDVPDAISFGAASDSDHQTKAPAVPQQNNRHQRRTDAQTDTLAFAAKITYGLATVNVPTVVTTETEGALQLSPPSTVALRRWHARIWRKASSDSTAITTFVVIDSAGQHGPVDSVSQHDTAYLIRVTGHQLYPPSAPLLVLPMEALQQIQVMTVTPASVDSANTAGSGTLSFGYSVQLNSRPSHTAGQTERNGTGNDTTAVTQP